MCVHLPTVPTTAFMKNVLLSLYLLVAPPIMAQPILTDTVDTRPSTHALVVGISKYITGVPQLQYADRDAAFFAEYLQSKAGGSVPKENIHLLLNEEATTAAVFNAIYTLLATCQKDDVVYFYFSGHGDLETKTIHNNGYLICYDSPPHNYVNMALPVAYLNDVTNTLSVKNGANVILITDACHSGKLAGSKFNGNFLVGEQLRTVRNKEVRITSCSENQLSLEMPDWGGGRGVFSYYLINGLRGLSDKEKDGWVTVDEIKEYMATSLATDEVLLREKHSQTPVIDGKGNFRLAKVDNVSIEVARKEIQERPLTMPADINEVEQSLDNREFFFDLFEKIDLVGLTDSLRPDELTADQVPFAIIGSMKTRVKNDSELSLIEELENSIRASADELKRFKARLAVTFHNHGQQAINHYLTGDEAELERRRYYNAGLNSYAVYIRMFATALKLVPENSFQHNALQVKLHYFTGLVHRLQLPMVADKTMLIKLAMNEQMKALALEENAAYIFNELGILEGYSNHPEAAEKHYLKATTLAPSWALPWTNLAGLYVATGKLDNADAALKMAKELQPGFQNNFVATAYLEEQKMNLLKAEEFYRKSININTRHYLPFERLGLVYMNTTQYALADSFLKEAEIRKAGFHFEPFDRYPISAVLTPLLSPDTSCYFDRRSIADDDAIGHFVWAMSLWNDSIADAEIHLKKSIAADRKNPLAFHFLGKILHGQKRWQEAEIIFKMAKANYLDTPSFAAYCDSLSTYLPTERGCIYALFRRRHYEKAEDFFLLADVFEQWEHPEQAVAEYRGHIQLFPSFGAAYAKLWKLLESMGRDADVERTIIQYSFAVERVAGQDELAEFYKRKTLTSGRDASWYYKRGALLYHMAETNPGSYPFDQAEIAPDSNYVRLKAWEHKSIQSPYSWFIPGLNEIVGSTPAIVFPKMEAIQDLLKADSLRTLDEEALADVNNKLGDLYVWLGLPGKSAPHYATAAGIKPGNANILMKLAGSYVNTYQLQNALAILDSLHARKAIDLEQQVLLAKLKAHEGKYNQAESLLAEAKKNYPYTLYTIADLQARTSMLAKQNKKAINLYKQVIKLNESDPSAYYTLSRLYVVEGNVKAAQQSLQQALARNFNHSLVLKYDPVMNKLRKTKEWTQLLDKYGMNN